MARHLLILSLALAAFAFCLAPPARAQDEPTDEPAVFTADTVTFDDTLDVVIASGAVEIWQGQRILRADRVTYNRRTEAVTAVGNVVLVEPDGEVVFADYAELEEDFAKGFVENVSLLMTDNSRMIANSGVKYEGGMEVERAVYSPCNLCPEQPRRAPIWQIRAVRVIHDEAGENVIYRDVFFDFFGIPVLYTPYFSHPEPGVERRSGFLFPAFGSSSDLGPFVTTSYYWDIAPEQDATIDLGVTGKAGYLLGGEYRRRFENGLVIASGSVNRSDRAGDSGRIEEDAWRGHFFGDARFDLSERWRAGADVNVASDDDYLDTFNFSGADVLESRLYAEGFYGLSYAVAEGYRFQDLRSDDIAQATILPWLRYHYVGPPGAVAGGQVIARADALSLAREGDVDGARRFPTEGIDTRRLSLDTGWQRVVYSKTGLVTNLFGGVRGDLYWSDDLPASEGSTVLEDDVVAGRVYPRAVVTSRYPLVRQQGTMQQLVEPIAGLMVAPEVDDTDDIPNNDSIDLEFDEINLFSESRFTGIDRVEGGTRLTYGLRAGLFAAGGGSATAFLGQSYRITGGGDFPEASGLEDDFSDVVGRVTVAPSPVLNFDYRFRYDNENFEARRQEVMLSGGWPILRGRLNYTFLDDIGAAGTRQRREEVLASLSSRFSQYWSGSTSARYDLAEDEARTFGLGLTYQDECLTFGVRLERELTEPTDDTIFVVLSLRNLGEVPLDFGGGLLGVN